MDGGNIQVERFCPGPAVSPDEVEASTLILDPVLLTQGVIGAAQVFEVSVFGTGQAPLAGQAVTLTAVSASGAVLQTLTAIANTSGKALFTVPVAMQPREYEAVSNDVGSNTVHVTPVF